MGEQELTTALLRYAYLQGAFPMAMERGAIEWFQPFRRALLPIEGIRVSRSLRRSLRSARFEVLFDTSFEAVIRGCVRPSANWINEEIVRVYTEAHGEGWAHCCETWRDSHLVGGVYGLALGGCFCAESMFHRETDASKVALHAMVERCRELGFEMFDAQVMNPHLRSLGAYDVPHRQYLAMLAKVVRKRTAWSSPAP